MPKRTKHPKLRSHTWTNAAGRVATAYYFDMRGTGQPDVALGTDFDAAVVEWDKLYHHKARTQGTCEEAFARWERERLPTIVNATTRRNYRQSLSKLRPVFGPAAWAAVRVPTIKEYLTLRSAKTQANREVALFSVIWGCAREWELTDLPFPTYKMRVKNPEKAAEVEWTEAMFAAMYVHAEPFLRDAMDLISATGWRVRDAIKALVTDVRDDALLFKASKTGKRGKIGVSESAVLPGLIERRRALKVPHLYLLTRDGAPVTERMLTDGWARARRKALADCPEVAGLMLRYVRKYAGQLAGSLQAAQALLQHGSGATTQRHYLGPQKMRPAR